MEIKTPDAIFVWIPKNAGSSIHHILRIAGFKDQIHEGNHKYFDNKGRVNFGHADIKSLRDDGIINQDFFDRAFKFCFVRNPFDRAVSLYFFLSHRGFLKGTFREFLEAPIIPIGSYNIKGNSQINPQIEWIRNAGISFIGRVENIQTDMNSILDILDLPHQPVLKKNVYSHPHYREVFDSETRKLAEERYREDLDEFNYEF